MNCKKFAFYFRHTLVRAVHSPFFLLLPYSITQRAHCIIFAGTGFFTGTGSTDLRLFFAAIPYLSILLIPVVAAGTGGTEYDETFPLSSAERTVVSFLSPLAQFCIMTIPMLLVPVCVNMFGDVDPGQISTGFFLVVFYEMCVISFCVLAASAFSRPVAFILSAVFTAASNFLQLVQPLRGLSFSYHFDAASKGILDTRDILFYLCLSAVFLFSSVFVQEKKKGRSFSGREKRDGFALAAIIVLTFLNSTRYYRRTDLTNGRQFTVSAYSTQLLSRLDDPLKITYFRSPSLIKLYPQVRDIYDYLDEYASENKHVSLRLADPDKEKTAGLLDSYGIRSQQIQTGGVNKTEYLNVYSAVVLEYSGQTQVIPFLLSVNTLEYDLDRSVETLLTGKKISVALLCGNGMNTDSDYSYVVPWLSSQGIECTQLVPGSLQTQLSGTDTKKVLIVFGSSKLSDDDASAVESFLLRGGTALFAVSPYNADIAGDWTITKPERNSLLDMLASYGFSFTPEIAADVSCARITMTSDTDAQGKPADSTHSQQMNYPLWISVLPQTDAIRGMTAFWAAPVTIENGDVRPLIVTSPAAWTVDEDDTRRAGLFETNPFIVQTERPGTDKSRLVLGAYLDGKIRGYFTPQESEPTKIAVLGDQYFVNSLMLEYAGGSSGDYRNLDFLTHMILKLSGAEGLENVQNKNTSSTALYKMSDTASFRKMMIWTNIILFAFVPVLYGAAYILSLLQRRKKNKDMGRSLTNAKK